MEQKTKPALKIINIGGTTDVTGNITVYESGDDIIVVDCGIGFPDADMPGVDVVIPDFFTRHFDFSDLFKHLLELQFLQFFLFLYLS